MIEYSLTPFELQFLLLAAERRSIVKQAHGVVNRKHQHKSDFSTHLVGVMGEYAVAKLLGLKLDTSVHIGGDGGKDLEKNGFVMQVKTRNAQPEPLYLYVNGPDELRADIIVGASAPSLTEVRILGWLPKQEFLAAARPLNFGYGSRIGVRSSQLRDASTLLAHIDSEGVEHAF